jgi:hypothetical protein
MRAGNAVLRLCTHHQRPELRVGTAEQPRALPSSSQYATPFGRDSIGDAAIAGDRRWAGAFGVNMDLVARSHCSVEMILLEDMQVLRGSANSD